MTNLYSVLKNQDITLQIKVLIVKAMEFPVVMSRCESCIIKRRFSHQIESDTCDPADVACQVPLRLLTIPSPGDLLDTGIEPRSPALQVDSLPTDLSGRPKKTEH